MNRADLMILVGMDCEHAFLPALLEASKNPRIQTGRSGYVDCSQGIIPREVPKTTGHSAGDVHPYGNPHYMLDPVSAKLAIENIYNALVAFAPQDKAHSSATVMHISQNSMPRFLSGKKEMKPLKGVKFVSYHEHWPYFAARFGIEYFGTIELRPGIDPTARHIEELVASIEGTACSYRGARASVPRESAETHRRTDRRDHDNFAHHAWRRARYGNIYQDDGLYCSHDVTAVQSKK